MSITLCLIGYNLLQIFYLFKELHICFYLFYVYRCFPRLYVCIAHECQVHSKARRWQLDSWSWNYRQLGAATWMQGIELGLLEEQPVFFITLPSLQSPYLNIWKRLLHDKSQFIAGINDCVERAKWLTYKGFEKGSDLQYFINNKDSFIISRTTSTKVCIQHVGEFNIMNSTGSSLLRKL